MFLPIVKKFRRASGPRSVVTDDLIAGPTPADRVETGGYFTFDGGWSEQRVTGHVWITDYQPGERASNPVVLGTGKDEVLVLWQKIGGANPDGSTWCVRLDTQGKILHGPIDLGEPLIEGGN